MALVYVKTNCKILIANPREFTTFFSFGRKKAYTFTKVVYCTSATQEEQSIIKY